LKKWSKQSKLFAKITEEPYGLKRWSKQCNHTAGVIYEIRKNGAASLPAEGLPQAVTSKCMLP